MRTKSQMEADRFKKENAEVKLRLAEGDLRIYKEFSIDQQIAEFTSEIDQQEAQLEASQFRLDLSQQTWRPNTFARSRAVASSPPKQEPWFTQMIPIGETHRL